MRNLKRALSLALACVMLLGMMVMGTSASTFNDADSIVNKEAVEIAAGLGLFAGTDGNFMPTGTVTRAQMATIIVKMLYGSDFNADSYKGMNTFSDTAAFEGGWAEGYINACVAAKVVGGYGDGTFKPGNPVTTAEALTMIINALKVDAGEGTWPMTVMAKAEEMKLFGELSPKPQTNVALTRDALAVICVEGLNYSPSGIKGYVVEGIDTVFTDYIEAYFAAGTDTDKVTPAAQDTLATKVFNLKTAEGIITGNQATGDKATILNNSADAMFAIETGLDMIGHRVTVYYGETFSSEEEPGVAYAVVDDSTVVTVAKDIDEDRTKFRAAFGSKAYAPATTGAYEFDGGYNFSALNIDATYDEEKWIADAGTYVIYDGKVVSYIAPTTVYAAYVTAIDTDSIYLSDGSDLDNTEDLDVVVEYDGIAKGDYLTYAVAQGIVVLTKAEAISGTITSAGANKDGQMVITVDGTEYVEFGGSTLGLGLTTSGAVAGLDMNLEYSIYLTADGKYIGVSATEAAADIENIVYVVDTFAPKPTEDFYGNSTQYVYAQGVNIEGEEAHILVGADINGKKLGVCAEEGFDLKTFAITKGFYQVKELPGKDNKKYEIMTLDMCVAGYDAKENPYFVGTNRYATTDDSTISFASGSAYAGMHVCTAACPVGDGTGGTDAGHTPSSASAVTAYFTPNSKQLFWSQESDGSLKTAVVAKANWSYKVQKGMQEKIAVLMTRDSSGVTNVLMMVINEDPAKVGTSFPAIYIHDTAYDRKVADGYQYDVYNAGNGKVVTLTMTEDDALKGLSGFYYYSEDEDGIATIEDVRPDFDPSEGGLYFTNRTFTHFSYTGSTRRINAWPGTGVVSDTVSSSTKVIDLRSEEQMKIDGVDEITTADRIAALRDSGKLVQFDLGEATVGACGAIFVKSLIAAPVADTLFYVGDRTSAPGIYDAYNVAAGETQSIFVNNGIEETGFVNYKFNGTDFVVKAATVAGALSNKTVTAIDGDIVTVDGKTGKLSEIAYMNTTGVSAFDEIESLVVGSTVDAYVVEGKIKALFLTGVEGMLTEADLGDGKVMVYMANGGYTVGKNVVYTMDGELAVVNISIAAGAWKGGKFFNLTIADGKVTARSPMSLFNKYDGTSYGSLKNDGTTPIGFVYHNNWKSYDAETRTLVTSEEFAIAVHGQTSENKPGFCGAGCGHYGSGGNIEADTMILTDDAVVVDTRDGQVYTGAAADTFLASLDETVVLDAASSTNDENVNFIAVGSYDTAKSAEWYAAQQ